jgi:uncharacterized phage protein gp47/JayE
MGYPVKTFDQIVASMIAYIVANSTTITDFNAGSIIRSFCEATGLVGEEIYVALYLGFQRQLANIPQYVFNLVQKVGTVASVNLVFGCSVSAPQAYPIPIGTQVQTASGIVFSTTSAGSIPQGSTVSGSIPAVSNAIGYSNNVAANTLTSLIGSVNGINSVTNPNSATGGTDSETPYQYNQRFQAYIEGLGVSNIAGLIFGALSVTGITSASVIENFPPVSNVNVSLYIDNGQVGGVSAATIAQVQSIINGNGSTSNPGYRAAGVNVVVYAPSIVTINVVGTVHLISGANQTVVFNSINTALTNYINSLGVGANVIYNELISAVMGVYGVANCVISSPSSDTTILPSQVGRVGTITFTPN